MSTDNLKTIRDSINEALKEEMQRDDSIILLGEDIGAYGGVFKVTKGLFEQFGEERVIDTPISESGFLGAAVGAAMTGLRPVVEIMWVDFTLVGIDQILNQAAKMSYMSGGQTHVPMVIRTQGGGGRGNGAQHSQSLETIFCHIPGIKVVMPSTSYDAKGLLKAAIRDNAPVMFIEHKMMYNNKGIVPDEDYIVPLGVADVKKEGEDVTIVTISSTVPLALEAATTLQKEGINAEIIDLRSLVPMDVDTVIQSLKKTNRLVIAHEAHLSFGWGAELVSRIQEKAFDHLDAPIRRVATEDTPIAYNLELERETLPQVEDIINAVKETMYMTV